ncbi:MAG: hypothetical protein LBV13_06080 [Methanomassiliicoccaceae archaeon]|jgi:hypothetical protein|nr:hypothetical protein [Methanomassiliicoccaceae archaeon]
MFVTIFSIFAMIAQFTVIVYYFFAKKNREKDWTHWVYFVTVFVTGMTLHALGLLYKNDANVSFNPLLVFAASLGATFRMFTGTFDASAISMLARDNSFYAAAAAVTLVSAMLLLALVVIKVIGKNAVNTLKLFWTSRRDKYIVVGASEQTDVFLKGLNDRRKRNTIIVLEAKDRAKKNGMMFKGYAVVAAGDQNRKGRKNERRGGDAPEPGRDRMGEKDFVTEMTKALVTAGYDIRGKSTKVISLSDDDETNLLVAKIVTDHIRSIVNPEKKNGRIRPLTARQEELLSSVDLTAHIMYSSVERTEHFAFAEYALGRVRFFNPYEVRARKMLWENPLTSLIPDEWINTDKARLKDENENGLDRRYKIGTIFVGYGQTNRNILKKSICNFQMMNIDHNALIIDKGADKLEMQLRNMSPGLFREEDDKGNITRRYCELDPDRTYFDGPDEKYNIKFANLDVQSSEFYRRVMDEIRGEGSKEGYDLVTIIIALGTDRQSIETALELRQKLYEMRLLKKMIAGTDRIYDAVRIFVKIQKDSVLSDDKLLNDPGDIDSVITTFGSFNETLSVEYIIEERLDRLAKHIANDYWKISADTSANMKNRSNTVTKWDSLTEFKRDSNRYAALAIKTKLHLLGFDLDASGVRTDDDVASEYRKRYGVAVYEAQMKEKEKGNFVDFAERDDKGMIADTARNNLAILEHQRWNAHYLTSGWTKLAVDEVTGTKRQDEKSRQHACITTYDELYRLRDIQSDALIEDAKRRGEDLPLNKALSEADTASYDFYVMDRLIEHLNCSGCYAIRRRRT